MHKQSKAGNKEKNRQIEERKTDTKRKTGSKTNWSKESCRKTGRKQTWKKWRDRLKDRFIRWEREKEREGGKGAFMNTGKQIGDGQTQNHIFGRILTMIYMLTSDFKLFQEVFFRFEFI